MKKKGQSSPRRKNYIFWITAAVCVFFIILSAATDKAGGPFRFIANYTVVPMQKGINTVGAWLGDLAKNFETMKEIRAENDELSDKVADLTEKNNILKQEEYELSRLRELFKLDQQYADYEKTGARITAKDSGNWFNSFIIDKGSNDGIKTDMNVIADKGLVGIVVEVGPDWARVRSIIDDESNVSAMTLSTSDNFILSGDLKSMQDGTLPFSELPNTDTDIKKGEQVVTSNISSKYLPGIFIGYVSDIKVDSNKLTRSGHVTPAVDFKHLREVLVITSLKNENGAK